MHKFSPLDIKNCNLNENRIDLWQFSLKHELNISYQYLNAEEKARGERFYFAHHKRRFTTARATLRILLARYLNTAPERLEFTYNPQGKPSVVNFQKLQFNLSHSQDLAFIAIGQGFPVGVDVEHFSARPYEGIAKHLFSERELSEFNKTPSILKPAVFFHIWSQKEAFIKASGLGLSYPTKDFSVPTCMPTRQLVNDPFHQLTWKLQSFMPAIGCSAALCFHPTVTKIRFGILELSQHHMLTI